MWVRIDDRAPGHPKLLKISVAARWLWIEGLCSCASYLTDGAISHAQLNRFSVPEAQSLASDLVAAGLWEETPEGWRVHDYLDYQASKKARTHWLEKERARKKAEAARKKAEVGDSTRNPRGSKAQVGDSTRNPRGSKAPGTPRGFRVTRGQDREGQARTGSEEGAEVIELPSGRRVVPSGDEYADPQTGEFVWGLDAADRAFLNLKKGFGTVAVESSGS